MTAMEGAGVPEGDVDIVLAPMRRRHLRSVLRIESQVYQRPWTPGLFASELALVDQRTYLVAKVGGRVVGYGGVLYVLPDAHVTTLVIDPAWRRAKVATRLLLALSRAAIATGASALTLEVRASNEPAQALYRRFGFVPAGVRRKYYADDGEDALIMWLHDVDEPAFAARLDALAAEVTGATVVEGAG
jgi:ribosomal-protein-alanine N-acetyltransferase